MEDLAEAFNDMSGRLREMYGNLAQQVNERSRELVRSERLASVGFLAAGVAHEINNPLNIISGYAELSARQMDPDRAPPEDAEAAAEDREQVRQSLRVIREEAFRCKEITEKLLS